jgi:hypothetical protein
MRMAIKLTLDEAARIRALQEVTGTGSYSELLENALSLLEWAVKQQIEQ